MLYESLSRKVIGTVFNVHNILGAGLLEAAYEGALVVELEHIGLKVGRQVIYPLHYRGQYIGAYIAALVVEDKIILELKSVFKLNPNMEAQLINYLKLSKVPVGYLINFRNVKVNWRRFENRAVGQSSPPFRL